jgi:predicted amidohydrolase YtcJ
MMRRKILLILGLPAFLTLSLTHCRPKDSADLALVNGRIYVDVGPGFYAEAAAVKAGRIKALGSNSMVKKYVSPATRVLDLSGKLALPGFIDAHCHFASGGKSLSGLTLREARSVEDVQKRVAARINELPEGAPVWGSEFDHTLFPGARWPSKEDLDKVSPGNPVILERVDGHSVWANSLALRLSGISAKTADPFGGEISRDPRTGEPTGILKEAAVSLIKIPPPEANTEVDIKRALALAARLGLTGIHTSATLEELEIYRKLERAGELTLRVNVWLPIQGMDDYIKSQIKSGQGDEMVRVGFLKVFIDGTISSSTALLFEPFSDEPDKRGEAQYPEEEFYGLVGKAHRNGYQVGIHAIGDKGIHWALNAIERAQKEYSRGDARHRIEHCSLIDPADVKRFAELGVIASMQPTHCTTDLAYCEQRFGLERCRGAYIWKTLADEGAVLAFGTDWPVEPLDPLRGLYSCVSRRNIETGDPPGGWFPEQRLSIRQAVRFYTYGPAYASFEENTKGSLRLGKLADFVVLSDNILEIDASQILAAQVLYTIVGGKIVFPES